MKQNRLFKKMFFMTMGLGVAILCVQFLFQYFWLDDFYYFSKEISIHNELVQIEQKIISSNEDSDKIEAFILKASDQTDTAIAVFDRYGQMFYGLNYQRDNLYVTLLSEKGTVYQVYLYDYYDQEAFLETLEVGKKIRVKGYVDKQYNNEVFPNFITVDGVDYKISVESIDLATGLFEIDNASVDENIEDESALLKTSLSNVIEGKIIFSNTQKQLKAGSEYKENQLFDQQFKVFSENRKAVETLNDAGYVSFRTIDDYTGLENLVSIKLIEDIEGEALFIFSVLPLQSVKKITDIIQSYFYMTLIVAFLLAILFAYFFSKKITSPLLHLYEVTTNLANIDFSQQCDVKTNDEIEDLAHNINVMSKQLENTLKQLKQFLADASHELKTPLTVMKGVVEGMMDGIYDVKNPVHYKCMLAEINDMSQLVYDLLELSKLESREVNFKEEVFQLSDLVLKVHSKMSYLVADKNLQVSLQLDDSFVKGNEQYIETVIRNYYANAIQYTPSGGMIEIKVFSKIGQTKFQIFNKPSRISEEALDKLWQPFFRVEQSRNKALGGTGLGLYMVKKILDRHESVYGILNENQGVQAYFSLKSVSE